MRKFMLAFLRDEEGLTMVEYAVAGSLVTAAGRRRIHHSVNHRNRQDHSMAAAIDEGRRILTG